MRSGRIRRVASLSVALIALLVGSSPALAPGVAGADPIVAPTVAAFMSDYNPREWHADPSASSAVTAYATITEPGSASETYTCTVDYGDGTVVAGAVSGLTCTGPLHQYLVSGTYAVKVTVTDSSGASGTGTTGATYENWAPWVGGGLVGSFTVGSTVNDVAAVVDPGAAFETYTCTVDYGDGSGVQPGTYVPTGWSDGLPRCVGPDHVYAAPGSYSIITTATDSAGETGSSLVIETIGPAPIVVGSVSAPATVDEGSSVAASASFTPTGGPETYTCTVDYGDGSGPLAGVVTGSTCQGPSHRLDRVGAYTITVVVTDSAGASGSASKLISVANVPPTITEMSMVSLAKVGSTVKVAASFSDPGTGESYQATWDWGDGRTSVVSLGSSPGSFSASHTYTKAGLYEVWLTVGDGSGSTVASRSLVVYDPARTLAGSGSLASPAGACRLSTRCGTASTATFSISAKYGKTSKPTVGVFFSAKDFSFSATSADWFVAADGTAVIQGTGKVNGLSGYSFFLVAVDGRPDTLRLSVFNTASNLVYDLGSRRLKSGSISIK